MRIAFDLDNTLIRCGYDFPLEKPRHRIWAKLLGGEQLRQGTKEITEHCRRQGWEVWVYTYFLPEQLVHTQTVLAAWHWPRWCSKPTAAQPRGDCSLHKASVELRD